MDAELKVMGELQEVFEKLPNDDARFRVASYFADRFHPDGDGDAELPEEFADMLGGEGER